ncbi:MAG: tRNA dihydrouridine synthase DusB [Bdellovibrionota bacterium]
MPLAPLSIGSVAVQPNLVLAPMSGVTNIAFRRLIKELNPGAVGLVVTEFISIEGLTRANAQSLQMMRYTEGERPISIQIFGYEISRMVDAAKMVEDAGADIVDINCGCPVPKVVRKGGGCELMRQPDHLAKMLTAVKQAVKIPLTLKIRAGWDNANRNALSIGKMAEDCGVSMLAVHGRSRQDLYRGKADWTLVGEVARALKIPVIGSGDVVSFESAVRAFEQGVQGIMIGRAALSNPWVFSEIQSQLTANGSGAAQFQTPPASAVIDVLERYAELLLESMSTRAALGRMKQLSSQITRRIEGSAPMRRELCTSGSLETMRESLKRFREELSHPRARFRVRSAYELQTEQLAQQEEAAQI